MTIKELNEQLEPKLREVAEKYPLPDELLEGVREFQERIIEEIICG